jgi:hypothetical protein
LITYDLCNHSLNPSNYPKTQIKGEIMIQLSYTKDCHTPNVVYFNPDWDEEPEEYHHHFKYYKYYSDKQALEILEDDTEAPELRDAIAEVKKWLDLEL